MFICATGVWGENRAFTVLNDDSCSQTSTNTRPHYATVRQVFVTWHTECSLLAPYENSCCVFNGKISLTTCLHNDRGFNFLLGVVGRPHVGWRIWCHFSSVSYFGGFNESLWVDRGSLFTAVWWIHTQVWTC